MRPIVPDLSKRARGIWGEERACTHYRRLGYAIVERNWRCEHGEIDVVARLGDTVVFCEVKTRRSSDFGGGAAAVDRRKQHRLRRLAAAWLATREVHGVEVRFDVVAITGVDVELIEGAF
jgi:putative endonuclease